MGSTIIGLLFVYVIVCFKGFCIGFTSSSLIYALGTKRSIILLATTMLFKNIVIIPCIIALAVSGMQVYKSIMQDRRKENIKLEITRHTIFSVLILLILVSTSFVEVYLSQNFMQYCIKFI